MNVTATASKNAPATPTKKTNRKSRRKPTSDEPTSPKTCSSKQSTSSPAKIKKGKKKGNKPPRKTKSPTQVHEHGAKRRLAFTPDDANADSAKPEPNAKRRLALLLENDFGSGQIVDLTATTATDATTSSQPKPTRKKGSTKKGRQNNDQVLEHPSDATVNPFENNATAEAGSSAMPAPTGNAKNTFSPFGNSGSTQTIANVVVRIIKGVATQKRGQGALYYAIDEKTRRQYAIWASNEKSKDIQQSCFKSNGVGVLVPRKGEATFSLQEKTTGSKMQNDNTTDVVVKKLISFKEDSTEPSLSWEEIIPELTPDELLATGGVSNPTTAVGQATGLVVGSGSFKTAARGTTMFRTSAILWDGSNSNTPLYFKELYHFNDLKLDKGEVYMIYFKHNANKEQFYCDSTMYPTLVSKAIRRRVLDLARSDPPTQMQVTNVASLPQLLDAKSPVPERGSWGIYNAKVTVPLGQVATLQHRGCGCKEFEVFQQQDLNLATTCPECNATVINKDLIVLLPRVNLQIRGAVVECTVSVGHGNVPFVEHFLPAFEMQDIFKADFFSKINRNMKDVLITATIGIRPDKTAILSTIYPVNVLCVSSAKTTETESVSRNANTGRPVFG